MIDESAKLKLRIENFQSNFLTKDKIIIFEENKFDLVETFAEKIAEMVIKDFDVNWIKLRVSKPGALRFSKDVGVIIERSATDYE